MQNYNSKFKPFKFYVLFLPSAFYLLTFLGCATAPYVMPTVSAPGMPGIYHQVEKGQTLWRISKLYSVDLDEIASINRISDASSIEIGRLVFIPSPKKQISAPQGYACDDFIWPIKGRIICSFGSTFNNMINKGINIQPYDNLDVVASAGGRVVFYAQELGPFGKTIIIEHGDDLSTVYSRNSHVFIKPGDIVQKGAVIAKAGSAGRDKNVYLHFEVRKGHISKNPIFYLP